MRTLLPGVLEPVETKRRYNASAPDVREASLRQSSDFSKLVYQAWKNALNAHGVTWQAFLSAAAANRDAWRRWLNDEGTWRQALEALVEKLNARHPDARFELGALVIG